MPEFEQGPCQCCNDPGTCLLTWCCPCISFMQVADDIGKDNSFLYCLLTFPVPCGCCVLTALGNDVQEKQGIDGGIVKAGACAFFDCCVCYSCAVANEAKKIKEEGAKAPAGSKIER